MNSIGERIAELRKSKNLSQEYIAERLDVTRQAVSKWEQDVSSPDTKNLIALAELLEVSVEYLATGKSALEAKEDKKKDGLGVSQVLGIVFIAVGLFSLTLGIILSWILIALAVILIVFGIIFVAVPKKAWRIIIPMIILTILALIPTMFTGLNIIIAMSIVSGSIAVVLVGWGVSEVIKRIRKRNK